MNSTDPTRSSDSPCLTCGACCAATLVSFYRGEADDTPGGWVPAALTEPLTLHLRCMRGTHQPHPHCAQLIGGIPGGRCAIHEQRPSPCRELEPWDAVGQPTRPCTEARRIHGLPPLAALSLVAPSPGSRHPERT